MNRLFDFDAFYNVVHYCFSPFGHKAVMRKIKLNIQGVFLKIHDCIVNIYTIIYP